MVFAMSDIHSCLRELLQALVDLSGNNKLVLLGDYIHGGSNNYGVLDKIMELQRTYGKEKVIALMGNHEESVVDGWTPLDDSIRYSGSYDNGDQDDRYINWISQLPRFYTEGNTI